MPNVMRIFCHCNFSDNMTALKVHTTEGELDEDFHSSCGAAQPSNQV